MHNPFAYKNEIYSQDAELAYKAVNGCKKSLESLIKLHQSWVYNLSFKMVMDHDDALDITQEILIKIITNLGSYNCEKASFRTWLYKIAVNHILNMKKKKFEIRINDFNRYIYLIENLEDHSETKDPEENLLAKEFQTGCMSGMLMCLGREERIAFILGAVFDVEGKICAEIMNISDDNFRKKLSRARKKLHIHMNSVCGHVNPENNCRCSKKYKNFIEMKMIDPDNLRYLSEHTPKIKEVIEKRVSRFKDLYYEPFFDLYRKHPFYNPPDMVEWFDKILNEKEFKEIFNISGKQ
ncbi:MAG: RNA polymerase sigma factor [Thermodesulfobacteriota bacterium]